MRLIAGSVKKLFTIQHEAFQEHLLTMKDLRNSQNRPSVLIIKRTEEVVHTLFTGSEIIVGSVSPAKQAMSELVFGKEVELRPHTIDRYGRLVARVLVSGQDAGLELLKQLN